VLLTVLPDCYHSKNETVVQFMCYCK